jgi:hypothetical protein
VCAAALRCCEFCLGFSLSGVAFDDWRSYRIQLPSPLGKIALDPKLLDEFFDIFVRSGDVGALKCVSKIVVAIREDSIPAASLDGIFRGVRGVVEAMQNPDMSTMLWISSILVAIAYRLKLPVIQGIREFDAFLELIRDFSFSFF